jgi:DNA-binding response OmpR family regulator
MTTTEHRAERPTDRRRAPRGGRREHDTPGQYPLVLVADSDNGARRPCVQYLIRRGFLVDEAHGGDEATSAVRTTRPRLVLVDAALPAKRRLLPSIQAAGIPMIVMTTDFMEPATNAAGVLIKPFPLEAMLTEVRRVLRLFDRADEGAPGPT